MTIRVQCDLLGRGKIMSPSKELDWGDFFSEINNYYYNGNNSKFDNKVFHIWLSFWLNLFKIRTFNLNLAKTFNKFKKWKEKSLNALFYPQKFSKECS